MHCQAVALQLGLKLGSNGSNFAGNYSTKGLYAYSEGELAGHAFFGLYGDSKSLVANVPFPKYRPRTFFNQSIRNVSTVAFMLEAETDDENEVNISCDIVRHAYEDQNNVLYGARQYFQTQKYEFHVAEITPLNVTFMYSLKISLQHDAAAIENLRSSFGSRAWTTMNLLPFAVRADVVSVGSNNTIVAKIMNASFLDTLETLETKNATFFVGIGLDVVGTEWSTAVKLAPNACLLNYLASRAVITNYYAINGTESVSEDVIVYRRSSVLFA